MEPVIEVTRSELAAALAEWERRWREDPDAFEPDSDRWTVEEYGDDTARYLFEILAEQKLAEAVPDA